MAFIPKILIVNNQETTSPLWAFNFPQQQPKVIFERDPRNALKRLAETLPDLVVLDVDSEAVVLNLIRKLREEAVMPILLLATSRNEQFLLEAYKSGVDECILKPISVALFRAKVMSWLLRSLSVSGDMLHSLRVGTVTLIPSERTVLLRKADPVRLTNLELRLMYYLMGHPRRTLTTKELCQRLWGYDGHGNAVTLKNTIHRLRRKIESDPRNPQYIRTVAGIGYRFIPE